MSKLHPSVVERFLASAKIRVLPGVHPFDSTSEEDLAKTYGEAFTDANTTVVACAASDGTHYIVATIADIKRLCEVEAEEYGLSEIVVIPTKLWTNKLKDKVVVGELKPLKQTAKAA